MNRYTKIASALALGIGLIAVTALAVRPARSLALLQSRGPLAQDDAEQRRAWARENDPEVQNMTKGLVVLRTDKDVDEDLIRVTLRNDYPKTITGYDVAVGVGRIYSEAITEETSEKTLLRSGQTRVETYPLQVGLERLGIVVLSVVFEDGSTDGEPGSTKYIKDYRAGTKIALQHVLSLLEPLRAGQNITVAAAMPGVRDRLATFGAEQRGALSAASQTGFEDARYRLDRQLARLEADLESSRQSTSEPNGLSSLVMRIEKTVGEL